MAGGSPEERVSTAYSPYSASVAFFIPKEGYSLKQRVSVVRFCGKVVWGSV